MWLLRRAESDAIDVGRQGPPKSESVRLRPSVSLGFPPGEMESFVVGEEPDSQPTLTTTFLGLYGAHSPLPNFYSEEILHRAADDEDHPVRDFFDIFNHRLLSLLYRGMIKYRGYLLFDGAGSDEFSWRLFALQGLAAEGTVAASELIGPRLLRFAGLWCQQPRSAAATAAILSVYLNCAAIRIEECVRRWVYLTDDQRSRLGVRSCRVGDDATIGERVADHSGKYRIVIGPLDYETFCRFLPGGDMMQTLSRLAPLAAGDWLDCEICVVLRRADAPQLGLRLGTETRLGWTTGLFDREPDDDVAVIFS
jgi:type VI secretion system protein ImpH